MGISPCRSKHSAINRGAWTADEDMILKEYITIHGARGWRSLPIKAGLKRCGKSCRLRWLNYLRPDIKRGNISDDEDELIIRLHRLLGNRWSLIAGRLPGRTGNEIKNHWNTHLRKKSLPHYQPIPKPNTKSNLTPPGDDGIVQYTPIKPTAVRLSKNCNKYGDSGISDHQDFNFTDAAKHTTACKSWSKSPSEESSRGNESSLINLPVQNDCPQLGSPSVQIIYQLSPPCMPNLVNSPWLPSKHCRENKSDASGSLLNFNQVQSGDCGLLSYPYYSLEDFRFGEFVAMPGNNLEGLYWLHEQDESFTVTDNHGRDIIYSSSDQHDLLDELNYF